MIFLIIIIGGFGGGAIIAINGNPDDQSQSETPEIPSETYTGILNEVRLIDNAHYQITLNKTVIFISENNQTRMNGLTLGDMITVTVQKDNWQLMRLKDWTLKEER